MKNILKADIILPDSNANLSKWAVIACDQFTGDKNYWNDLKEYIGNSSSTINFIIPEVYLNSNEKFNCDQNIEEFIKNQKFRLIEDSYILINRETPYHNSRLGLVCNIDLENYDFSTNTKSIIRPSERTIFERVIPRIEMRKKSVAEFPHIMLLYDDRYFHILENLYNNKEYLEKLYDFDLNGNGGHLTGYKINEDLSTYFDKLMTKDYLKNIFGTEDKLLFIVGDGNHSLATAKTCWNEIKKTLSEEEQKNHISRFCLVEICNINDPGIEIYPIHRVIYNCSENCIKDIKNLYSGDNSKEYKMYYKGQYFNYKLPDNTPQAISLMQNFIEKYVKNNPETCVDYIHDEIDVILNCDNENALGIFLPALAKDEIFSYVIENGVLPKKSFSIGKSVEKRYYMEGRIINKNPE